MEKIFENDLIIVSDTKKIMILDMLLKIKKTIKLIFILMV